MAGKRENLATAWSLIQSQIHMDTPTEIGKYSGCTRTIGTIPIDAAQSLNEWRSDALNEALVDLGQHNQTKAYAMRDFVGQCVELPCELAQVSRSTLRAATTPSIDFDISLIKTGLHMVSCQDQFPKS